MRRHIEEIEAKLSLKMMSRFRIKAHLPFPFLCDLVSHPKLLDAVEDLIGPNILCWGSSFFRRSRETSHSSPGTRIRRITGLNRRTRSPRGSPYRSLSGIRLHALSSWISGQGVYSHDELVQKDNLLSRGQTVKGVDESRAVHVPLKAGQFSFHREDTLHASHPNSTNDRRIGLSIHYVAPDVRETNFPGASCDAAAWKGHARLLVAREAAKTDLDPDCLAELDRVFGMYKMAPQRGKKQVDPLRIH